MTGRWWRRVILAAAADGEGSPNIGSAQGSGSVTARVRRAHGVEWQLVPLHALGRVDATGEVVAALCVRFVMPCSRRGVRSWRRSLSRPLDFCLAPSEFVHFSRTGLSIGAARPILGADIWMWLARRRAHGVERQLVPVHALGSGEVVASRCAYDFVMPRARRRGDGAFDRGGGHEIVRGIFLFATVGGCRFFLEPIGEGVCVNASRWKCWPVVRRDCGAWSDRMRSSPKTRFAAKNGPNSL